jgi:hypothetical protein
MNQISQLLYDGYCLAHHHFSGQGIALLIVAMLLVLAFEVWMLIDVLEFRKVPTNSRVAWVVGMFLIHPFVAMAYILVRSRYKQTK